MKYNKGFAPVLVLVIVLGVLAVGGGAYFVGKSSTPKNTVSDNSNYFPPVQQNNNLPATSNTNNNVTPPVITKPSITVLSPNGGEIYKKGDTAYVRWNTQNIGNATIKIDLLKTNGTLVYNLASMVNPSKGSQVDANGPAYSWAIPTETSPGGRRIDSGQYKIQICETGTNNCDSSNSYFTITAPSVSTSNWKTYQNNSEKYSVKYPSTWYLDSFNPEFVTITNYDASVGNGGSLSSENIRIIISTYTNLLANETIESWVNRISSSIGLSERQNISIDGLKAIRGKTSSSGGDVRVVSNGQGYQIAYSPSDSKLVSTFDQILSTFKFTK